VLRSTTGKAKFAGTHRPHDCIFGYSSELEERGWHQI